MSRPYYTQRAGKTVPGPIDEGLLGPTFANVFAQFNGNGYFQIAYGKTCVDSGYAAGTLNMTMDQHLAFTFGSERKLPLDEAGLKTLSKDDIFDLAEYFHDHVHKPKDSWQHKWDGCGLHVSNGRLGEGQKDWREALNPLLFRLTPPHQLTAFGVIERVPETAGLKELVEVPTEYGDDKNVDARVRRAVHKFQARGASEAEQRDAVRELADVLEFLRQDLKGHIPKKDEADLFQIANGFGIRHHRADQKTEYSGDVYLPWVFYAYLATIDLMARIEKSGGK